MGILKWLSNHWFILAFVFSSGGAYAWSEVQRQELGAVVTEQGKQQARITEMHTELQVITTKQQAVIESQKEIKENLRELIRLQLKQMRED